MKNVVLIAFCFLVLKSKACLNEYTPRSSDGYYDGVYKPYRCSFDTVKIKNTLENLYLWKKLNDYKIQSDIAVNQLKLGYFQEALSTFIKLHKTRPLDYNLVANLGTAYELNNELDSALKYISLGHKLNNSSHKGSEYVHVLILKAKISMRDKSAPVKSILNISLENKSDVSTEISAKRSLIESHIIYQLTERLPFSPKQDFIIAQLLKELGDLQLSLNKTKDAYKSYLLALSYNSSHEGIDELIKDLELKNKELSPTSKEIVDFVKFCT